jgi:P4 family phage/plasmid primase-like protien
MIENEKPKPTTSDVPLGMPQEPNPEREAFLKRLKEGEADIEKFAQYAQTIEKELGIIDWTYPVTAEHPFNPDELAKLMIFRPEYNIVTDKTTQTIYLYAEAAPVYHKDGEVFLRFIIDKVLGNASKPHRINEVVELIKIKTAAALTPSEKISVENGILDIDTRTLEPFSRYEFITNKINAEFKPGVRNEEWEKFVKQVCPDDWPLLQEWSGYLLKRAYPFHLIMWLYGPTGRNGKGTWARAMQTIVGSENYSSVQIHEFDGKHRFAVYNLRDSLFNICSEPRTDRPLTIEMLQGLTGQDTFDSEKKNIQERYKLQNHAKMTIMGNKFPNIDHPTEAFWERLKLCKFPNRFVGKDQIQDLEKKLLATPEQRSGVLNWMLEGWQRVLKNGGFTMTKTQEETIIQFKRASDSPGAFLSEAVEFNRDAFTSKVPAFNHYKDYCDAIGVTPENQTKFNEKLRNNPKIKETKKRIGAEKQQTKGWLGITLKPLPEDEENEEETQQTLMPSGTDGTSGTALYTREKSDEISTRKKGQKTVPSVPTVPFEKEEGVSYEQFRGVAYVKHVRTSEPCYNGCALLAEWQISIGEDFKQFFCNGCYQKMKKELEQGNYEVKFAEGEQP